MDQGDLKLLSNLYAHSVYKKIAACAVGLPHVAAYPDSATPSCRLGVNANVAVRLHDVLRRPDWCMILPVMITDAVCGNTERFINNLGYKLVGSQLIRDQMVIPAPYDKAFQLDFVMDLMYSEVNPFAVNPLHNPVFDKTIRAFTDALSAELQEIGMELRSRSNAPGNSDYGNAIREHSAALFKFVQRLALVADKCSEVNGGVDLDFVHTVCKKKHIEVPAIVDEYVTSACKSNFISLVESVSEALMYLYLDDVDEDVNDEIFDRLLSESVPHSREPSYEELSPVDDRPTSVRSSTNYTSEPGGFKVGTPASRSDFVDPDISSSGLPKPSESQIDDLLSNLPPERAVQLKRLHQYDKKRQQEMEAYAASHLFD